MTRPLSILMTTDAVGGVWQYSLDLACALAPLGIHATLAVLGPAPDAAQRAEAAAVRMIDTGLPLDWLSDDAAPVLAAGNAIAALAAAERVDLVQLNMPALGARARCDVPVVAVMHGCIATWWDAAYGTDLPAELRWQRQLTGQALAAADAVVAPSASHAVAVARHYGLVRTPVAIHNGRASLGVATATMQPGVFTAGRLWDRVKDTALLDRVAARLDVPFRAAGPTTGPHGEAIAPAHLTLLGRLDTPGLAAELATRPIFVSAARLEPFGLAVLEAAAAGCPLVLSDIPTFRELWDGAALFAPPGDADAFHAAVARLLADPVHAARLGAAAAERARLYSPAAMASAMASLYARLADARVAA